MLKSWAVTKGPAPDPEIKRLAVRTEDHPMSYAEFEGTIPKGEYGGGTVMLWDRGTWEPVEGKSWKDIDKGHLHFTLDGERMKGEWILIRLKPRPGEKRENWLLRKVEDKYSEPGDALVDRELTSVLTGRSMAEIAADKAGTFSLAGKKDDAFLAQMEKAAAHNAKEGKPKAKRDAPLPQFRTPQLATLVDSVPVGQSLDARDQVRRLSRADRREGQAKFAFTPAAARTGRTSSHRLLKSLPHWTCRARS